jgi:hypothetical protein
LFSLEACEDEQWPVEIEPRSPHGSRFDTDGDTTDEDIREALGSEPDVAESELRQDLKAIRRYEKATYTRRFTAPQDIIDGNHDYDFDSLWRWYDGKRRN